MQTVITAALVGHQFYWRTDCIAFMQQSNFRSVIYFSIYVASEYNIQT